MIVLKSLSAVTVLGLYQYELKPYAEGDSISQFVWYFWTFETLGM